MLPTEGVGWKEVIAVVSSRLRWQRLREGPWNAEELELAFASASQPLAPLFLQRIFGATTRREKADRRLISRSDTAPMQCRSETVQNSALASLG